MQEKYRYLEHTADVMFEAFGRTEEELLENSALAMCNAMYELESVKALKEVQLKAKGKDLEELLHKFLEELLFEIETKRMFFSKILVLELKKEKEFFVKAKCRGEEIRRGHKIKSEVKAVTWHKFAVRREKGMWRAQVLVDI